MRNETRSGRNGVRRRAATPAGGATQINADLLSIPRLGEVRARALADAGVTSLEDLRNMSIEDLGRIKWIGPGNARLIKDWLDQQPADGTPSTVGSKPKGRRSARPKPAPISANSHDDSATEPGPDQELPSASLDETEELEAADREDSLTGDALRVDTAVSRIKEAIPKKSREKKLGRQLKKVTHSVAELPHSVDILPDDDKQAAAAALNRIATLLNKAVENGKLSAKKQEAMGAELKKFRKQLEKALGG